MSRKLAVALLAATMLTTPAFAQAPSNQPAKATTTTSTTAPATTTPAAATPASTNAPKVVTHSPTLRSAKVKHHKRFVKRVTHVKAVKTVKHVKPVKSFKTAAKTVTNSTNPAPSLKAATPAAKPVHHYVRKSTTHSHVGAISAPKSKTGVN